MSIDPEEQAKLTVIYDLLDRYQQLDKDKMLPLLAIRMLCIKHGYGGVMRTVQDIGIDTVVLAAKGQLMGIVKLWTKMVENNPPPEEIRDGVMENIDTVRRASTDVNVTARLYAQLTRMQLREDWLKFHSTPKAEGETTQ